MTLCLLNGQQNVVQSADGSKIGITIKLLSATGMASCSLVYPGGNFGCYEVSSLRII